MIIFSQLYRLTYLTRFNTKERLDISDFYKHNKSPHIHGLDNIHMDEVEVKYQGSSSSSRSSCNNEGWRYEAN